jgi:hypothetical protein
MDVVKLTMKHPDLEQPLMKTWIMTWTSLAIPNGLPILEMDIKNMFIQLNINTSSSRTCTLLPFLTSSSKREENRKEVLTNEFVFIRKIT